MLCQPDDLREVPVTTSISKVDVHLGLKHGPTSSDKDMPEQWLHCLDKVLRELRPFIIHIHHNGHDGYLTKEVLDALNEKQYLVQPQGNKWIIWPR